MPRPKFQRQRAHLKKARSCRSSKSDEAASLSTPPAASTSQTTADSEPQPSTSASDARQDPTSASARKLQKRQKLPEATTFVQKWALIHVDQLTKLVERDSCWNCGNQQNSSVKIREGAQMGFSSCLLKRCNCEAEISVMSSPRVDRETDAFEINQRMILFSHSVGGGLATLRKFGTALGIPVLSLSSYQRLDKRISAAEVQSAEEVLDRAAATIREAYADTDPEIAAALEQGQTPLIDIAVSFDGTWQKRGFTSLYGVGVCVEILTGLVIDFQVLSKYCHACRVNRSKLTPAAFREWKLEHAEDCCENHTGSSKSMEMVAARVMWERSIDKYQFRYVKMLADGDSAAYKAVCDSKPYGEQQVDKLECINHVHKRMGSALRKLATQERLGGRGTGRLTEGKAKSLQNYYRGAVISNSESVEKMRKEIWAGFYHSISSDEDHYHDNCPEGTTSFCWYQRAIADGENPPSHHNASHTYLSPEVAGKVAEVYRRMTNENLLSRMLHGGTQNANESLNAQIWLRCPKTMFVGKRRVEAAVARAVSDFNEGATSITAVLDKLWLDTSSITLAHLTAAEAERVKQAEAAATPQAQTKRKSTAGRRQQKRRVDEALEGETYSAGMGE